MDKNTFISVRLTSGTIRIFKETIRLMDNPEFIRFSVNEEGTLLAVEPYHRKTFTSFTVPKNLYSYNGEMVVSASRYVLFYTADWIGIKINYIVYRERY